MAKKICCRCKQEKVLDDFYPLKTHKDGHRSECKQCNKDAVMLYEKSERGIKKRKERRSTEKGKFLLRNANQRYYKTEKGRKKRLEYGREYEKTSQCIAYRKSQGYQDILTEWKETHVEYKKIKDKEYRDKKREENAEEVRYYFRTYHRERNKNDIEFKILCVLRSRTRGAILMGGGERCYKTKELLGCTPMEARIHLESQFTQGMSWNNYGYGKDKWNIDHIIPCRYFNLLDPEEQKKCFHYTNLQPLWQPENFTKGSKHNGVIYRNKPK
jgi:hypothetical protein